MSLINDALKQAQKAPPGHPPTALPPLQPVAAEPTPGAAWLLPAIAILLVVAAIFFIGRALTRHSVHPIAAAPGPVAAPPPVAAVSMPVAAPPPVAPPAAPLPVEQPPPVTAPAPPKLQGIFYSPTAPSAIVDGKTVHPGDQFGRYRVKAILKDTVTLVGPDRQEIQLGMSY